MARSRPGVIAKLCHRVFNGDKPYDRFIREQLAGGSCGRATGATAEAKSGAMPSLQRGSIACTLGRRADRHSEGEFDDLDAHGRHQHRVSLRRSRFAHAADHKSDPISQADYYWMLSFFQHRWLRLQHTGGGGRGRERFNVRWLPRGVGEVGIGQTGTGKGAEEKLAQSTGAEVKGAEADLKKSAKRRRSTTRWPSPRTVPNRRRRIFSRGDASAPKEAEPAFPQCSGCAPKLSERAAGDRRAPRVRRLDCSHKSATAR